MTRWVALVAVLTAVPSSSVEAQSRPDFSGAWTMDAARSETLARGGRGGRGGAAATLEIKQTASELSETRGPQRLTYKLDGSESVNQVMGRGGATTATSRARWDGAKLIIETTREIQGFSLTTTEVRSLDADGKELVIETTVTTPQGDQTFRQVFTRN